MEKFTVEVTEKHIKKGVAEDSSLCPIALALKRFRLKDVAVSEFAGFLKFSKSGKKYEAKLPQKAQTFVANFDEGKAVKPFSFVVRPVEFK